MYVTLICFLIIGINLFVFGNIFVVHLDKKKEGNYDIFDCYFIGLCLVGTLLNFWSLFFPTNISSLIFITIVTIFLGYKNKYHLIKSVKTIFIKLKTQKIFLILVVIITLITLFCALPTPKLYDSYLYHINAIQWIEEYKIVPGLTNLHDRFGFNSSILVLNAGFSFSSIYNQSMFVINATSFFVFFIWISKQIYFKNGVIGVFSILYLYYFVQQYILDISSPGTDLLPNIFVAFILLSLLIDNKSLDNKFLLYLVVPFFCLTLKLSSFPIAIIGIVAAYRRYQNITLTILKSFIFGLILVLPWIIRNIILSGYLIFPFENIDLFNFDWKVPTAKVIEIKKWVYSWAKIPFKDYHEVMSMTINEWFPIWWKNQLPINQKLFLVAIFSPLFTTVLIYFNKNKNKLSFYLSIFISILSFLFWIFTAPDFRFSFSFILFLALIPILFFEKIISKFQFYTNPIIIIMFVSTLFIIGQNSYNLFCQDYSLKKVSNYIYLPKDVYYVKTEKGIKFDSESYFTPNGNKIEIFEPNPDHSQCYDKFPCSWFLDSKLKLRGEKIQDGFKN